MLKVKDERANVQAILNGILFVYHGIREAGIAHLSRLRLTPSMKTLTNYLSRSGTAFSTFQAIVSLLCLEKAVRELIFTWGERLIFQFDNIDRFVVKSKVQPFNSSGISAQLFAL